MNVLIYGTCSTCVTFKNIVRLSVSIFSATCQTKYNIKSSTITKISSSTIPTNSTQLFL